MEIKFRDLRADEIDVRVAIVRQKGLSLLLYKDARVDQDILDETVGAMNWQREHLRDNANCKVGIWDTDKKQWVWKEDTGTESYTEKEKGLASDSFKRACFNWGIGRELYSAPFMWVTNTEANITPSEKDKTKYECKDNFVVTRIVIKDKKITGLQITNQTTKRVVFDTSKRIGESLDDLNERLEETTEETIEDEVIKNTQEKAIRDVIKNHNIETEKVQTMLKALGHTKLNELKQSEYMSFYKELTDEK